VNAVLRLAAASGRARVADTFPSVILSAAKDLLLLEVKQILRPHKKEVRPQDDTSRTSSAASLNPSEMLP